MKASSSPLRQIALLSTLVLSASLLSTTARAEEAAAEKPQMVLVTPSEKNFPETLRDFQAKVAEAGWSVLHVNNMAGTLSERGFTVPPVVIIDVCSGAYSHRILSQDDYRPTSAFMPCRVSIYQTSDGKVFVARMNAGAFAGMMPEEVGKVMTESDAAIGRIIESAVR